MAGMVGDPKLALYQISDSRARPSRSFISDLLGAFEKQRLQPFAVPPIQPRLASDLFCLLKSGFSLKTKLANPASYSLRRYTEPASDGGLCLALLPQAYGPNAPIFQLLKIAVDSQTIVHAPLDAGSTKGSHSIMRGCAPNTQRFPLIFLY